MFIDEVRSRREAGSLHPAHQPDQDWACLEEETFLRCIKQSNDADYVDDGCVQGAVCPGGREGGAGCRAGGDGGRGKRAPPSQCRHQQVLQKIYQSQQR